MSGVAGLQSALAPGGAEAERVAVLSWIMFGGGTVILVLVCAAVVLALFGAPRWRSVLASNAFVTGAGIVFPAVTLAVLLGVGLWLMRTSGPALGEGEPVRVTVVGEQWWWRVVYEDISEDISDDAPEGARQRIFETANELRIPVGRPVRVSLATADVIHSFWVPALAGKLDMIPGRTNTLTLLATEPGTYRGQCAEYCGGAHALMSFFVVAMQEADYAAWVAAQAADAVPPQGDRALVGQTLFLAAGCGGCHAVRGAGATGTIGPDLTHVGSRLSLAAATLPNDTDSLVRWIRDNQHIKPDNKMLPYEFLSEGEAEVIAAYLSSLQ